MLVRNASPRGHMWFRCLMFSLSGHVLLSKNMDLINNYGHDALDYL